MMLPPYDDFSDEQDRIFNQPYDKSFIVAGPPGTGKTVLALYRAQAILRQIERRGGAMDMYLMLYAKLLSQYTRQACEELEVASIVVTFHSWFYNFYRGIIGRAPPKVGDWEYDWQVVLQKLNSASELRREMRFLIIDEAQDLPPRFFMVASVVAKHLNIFADENQRITSHNSTLREIQQNSGINEVMWLLRNYRNTREIAELAAHFHTGAPTGIPDLPDRRGQKPKVIRTGDMDEFLAYIARFERNNDDLKIGVFTETKRVQRAIVDGLGGLTTNDVQLYYWRRRDPLMVDFREPGIVVVNYASVKGLEFDVVFIPELQGVMLHTDGADGRMKLYTMLSRARDQLYLMYSGGSVPPLLTSFPHHLLDWD